MTFVSLSLRERAERAKVPRALVARGMTA
jgi:hypothetical protein